MQMGLLTKIQLKFWSFHNSIFWLLKCHYHYQENCQAVLWFTSKKTLCVCVLLYILYILLYVCRCVCRYVCIYIFILFLGALPTFPENFINICLQLFKYFANRSCHITSLFSKSNNNFHILDIYSTITPTPPDKIDEVRDASRWRHILLTKHVDSACCIKMREIQVK